MTEEGNKHRRSETEGADGKQKRPRPRESPEEKAARLAVERVVPIRGPLRPEWRRLVALIA